MTAGGWLLVGAAIAALDALGTGIVLARTPPSRLVTTNHAGRSIGAVLGVALVPAVVLGVGVAWAGSGEADARLVLVLVAAVALALVGVADDVSTGGPRGLRGHVASLARGRPTTGIAKLVGAGAFAVAVAVARGGDMVTVLSTALVLALATNVWNTLDVVPGRAVKAGIVATAAALVAVASRPEGLVVAATLGGCLGVLPLDLRERAMLGDGGSNPLGFLCGFALVAAVPAAWLPAVAAALLALQVAAETVTISRLVERVAPLRWADRLGRRR